MSSGAADTELLPPWPKQIVWVVRSHHSGVLPLWPGSLGVNTLSKTTTEGGQLGELLGGRLDLECQVKEVGSGEPLSWGVMCAHRDFRIMTGVCRLGEASI